MYPERKELKENLTYIIKIKKMPEQKKIDRLIRGKRGLCPHCFHDKARSTIIGVF